MRSSLGLWILPGGPLSFFTSWTTTSYRPKPCHMDRSALLALQLPGTNCFVHTCCPKHFRHLATISLDPKTRQVILDPNGRPVGSSMFQHWLVLTDLGVFSLRGAVFPQHFMEHWRTDVDNLLSTKRFFANKWKSAKTNFWAILFLANHSCFDFEITY